MITLREITEDNVESVLALRSTPEPEQCGSCSLTTGISAGATARKSCVRSWSWCATRVAPNSSPVMCPAKGGPAGFYARLGFVPTGELDPEGEVLLHRPVHE